MAKRKLPAGERIYAIGDVHGRFDLFERLIGLIREDNAGRGEARIRIVLLGDIVDRGPRSADLLIRCKKFAETSDSFVVLKGNHEQTMVEALMGNYTALDFWRQFGGDETLRSWGVPDAILNEGDPGLILKTARDCIPTEMLRWIEGLPLTYRSGSYLFVHAGIRPGVQLSRQVAGDLLWIRDDFLDSEIDHNCIVVHGHSIREEAPELKHNRIGIDIGAYRTGRLAAVGLEADEQWTIIADETARRTEDA